MTTTVISTLYGNSTTGQRNYTRADLEAVNDEKARTLIPTMIVLGFLMIIGIVGNSLVCYVFSCRLRSGTQNFLIVCLAVLDLLSCVIAIPTEIADMKFYFIFESEGACKIMRFINTFCAIGSIFTLIVIAVDRYRKICKPFDGQLHMIHVRLSLIPIFGGALFFGWPAFVMYGLRTTETGIPGLNGKDCSTSDGIRSTMYPLLYNCILFLCFIILAITLITLYTFVLRETRRHNKYLKRNSDFNLPSSGHYNSEDSHSSMEISPKHPTSSYSEKGTNRSVQFEYSSNSTVNTTAGVPVSQPTLLSVSRLVDSDQEESHRQIFPPGTSSDHTATSFSGTTNTTVPYTDSSLPSAQTDYQPPSSSSESERRSSLVTFNGSRKRDPHTVLFNDKLSTKHQSSIKNRRRFRSKTTLIAFLVTLVFILSFLPHLSLQVTKLLFEGFDYNLEGSALVSYNLFLRSYFINSVSNPIIYGALNAHFSKQVKELIKTICRKS